LGQRKPGESAESIQKKREVISLHFGSFLQHYTKNRKDGDPWKLIINGDFIDFMRIHLPLIDVAEHLPEHTKKNAVRQLRVVCRTHKPIFVALTRFLKAGNSVVVVTGNHDAEWEWREVRTEFKKILWNLSRSSEVHFLSHLEFVDRYYYEPGKVFIEHGHFYDPYCNCQMKINSKNESYVTSFSHEVTRYQYKQGKAFNSLPLHKFDQWGFLDIILWVLSRPLSEIKAIIVQYIKMATFLILISIRNFFTRSKPPKRERQPLTPRLDHVVRPPLHTSLFRTVQAFYLDRIFLLFTFAFSFTFVLVSSWTQGIRLWSSLGVLVGVVFLFLILTRIHPSTQSTPMLRKAVSLISKEVQSPVLVMAHSHEFDMIENQDVTYINVGHWTVPHKKHIPILNPSKKEPSFSSPYLMIQLEKTLQSVEVHHWDYFGELW